MGSRHNRKRTRSRPRNRIGSRSSSYTFQDLSSFSTSSTPALRSQQQGLQFWEQPYHAHSPIAMDIPAPNSHCIRMFGGNVDDEAGLCAPMLQVVLDLFDGRIDYEDD